MRRLLIIITALIATGATALVASAGADDMHTYQIELDNAFGLVSDSEVRIQGVPAGVVTDLDINERKKAVVTIEISGELATFREDATCSSEPQSLIAEYFLDCQPGTRGDKLPEDGLIPTRSEEYGNQTFTTVQNDLVQNTLREPFKVRFALLLNEFGTALAGNPDDLNEAIRRGAPALGALDGALAILARQASTIRDLNVNSDRIISRLTDRREDVIEFIENAEITATASAARRVDLARNFQLLPGFLSELRPTLAKLGNLADAQTPLLNDLRATAPELNILTRTLPAFNVASEPAIRTLGDGAVIGRRALLKGEDEIRALRQATRNSYSAVNALVNLTVDLDDPKRAVESDTRAARDTGRPNPTGYTGFEGLLNYVYYQTGAINQFDQIGHLLHFTLAEFEAGPCGEYNAGPTVPSKSGGETTNPSEINRCVAWLGPNQPGINEPINEQPFDPSVCPNGSDDPELCGSPARTVSRSASTEGRSNDGIRGGSGAEGSAGPSDSGEAGAPAEETPLPDAPVLPDAPGAVPGGLGDLLGIDPGTASGDGNDPLGLFSDPAPLTEEDKDAASASDQALLDYLFGN